MKHLRETFTDEEWRRLQHAKNHSKLNWHDFLLFYCQIPEYLQNIKDQKGH